MALTDFDMAALPSRDDVHSSVSDYAPSSNQESFGSVPEHRPDPGTSGSIRYPGVLRNYLLGKNFFDYTLAEQCILRARSTLNFMGYNATLDAIRMRFPHTQCLTRVSRLTEETLSPENAERTRDQPHIGLMIKIGSVLSTGDRRDKDNLSLIISELVPSVNADRPNNHQPPASPPHSRPLTPPRSAPEHARNIREFMPFDRTVPGQGILRDAPTMGIYMSKLKEHCDKDHWQIEFKDTQVGHAVPWWKVEVFVQGHTFDAEGSTKKDARHAACKKACEHLNVQI